jgi:hypothetical protein
MKVNPFNQAMGIEFAIRTVDAGSCFFQLVMDILVDVITTDRAILVVGNMGDK